MAYASMRGRAYSLKGAQGCCDRCGCWRNLSDLVWQYDYRGPRLANLRIRVCKEVNRCLDIPFEHWRPIITPPDPVPVRDPRPEWFLVDEWTDRVTQSGSVRITQSGAIRLTDSSAADPS